MYTIYSLESSYAQGYMVVFDNLFLEAAIIIDIYTIYILELS